MRGLYFSYYKKDGNDWVYIFRTFGIAFAVTNSLRMWNKRFNKKYSLKVFGLIFQLVFIRELVNDIDS